MQVDVITIIDDFHNTKTTVHAEVVDKGWYVPKANYQRAIRRLCPAPKTCRCCIEARLLNGNLVKINTYTDCFNGNVLFYLPE